MNWNPDCNKMVWTENKLARNPSNFERKFEILEQTSCNLQRHLSRRTLLLKNHLKKTEEKAFKAIQI